MQGQAELAQRLADLRGSVGSFQDVTPNVVFGPAAYRLTSGQKDRMPGPIPDLTSQNLHLSTNPSDLNAR